MPSLKIQVPRSPAHPLTLIRVTHPQGTSETTVDDSHHTMHIELPEGVSEDEVDVVGEHCNARGQRDNRMDSVVIRSAKPKVPEAPTDKVPEAPTDKVSETVVASETVVEDAAVTVVEPVVVAEPKAKPKGKAKDKPPETKTEAEAPQA